VYETDPVNTLNVVAVLREQLAACRTAHGENDFNAAMGCIHPQVLGQLNQLAMQ
jgi:hypothetical protein